MNKIMLFFLSLTLYSNGADLFDLEKEKKSLMINYSERISIAKEENLGSRVALLDKTLECLKSSMSKRDILNCKVDERKRIMSLIKG